MGYTHEDEEQHLPPPEVEETLPLYEESQFHPLPSTLQPPDPKATPDEVRDFLVQIMQARGINTDHARRVAARWTMGTGRELRAYPVAMYRDIFGAEDAWIVYKEVRVLCYRKEAEKTLPKWVWGICFLTAAFILGFSLTIIVQTVDADYIQDQWSDRSVSLAAFGLFFGIMATPGFFVGMLNKPDPEGRAERELHSQWLAKPAAQAQGS